MPDFSSLTMAFAMIASLLLIAGGIKLSLARQTRKRGILMVVAAAVIVTAGAEEILAVDSDPHGPEREERERERHRRIGEQVACTPVAAEAPEPARGDVEAAAARLVGEVRERLEPHPRQPEPLEPLDEPVAAARLARRPVEAVTDLADLVERPPELGRVESDGRSSHSDTAANL